MTKKVPKKKDRPGVDRYGRTPLHNVAVDGDSSEVRRLLEEGADSNAQDDNGWTALHFAAQRGSLAIAELLIAAGARVDTKDANGNTPLLEAVFRSRGEGALIKLLRNAGADPHVKNNHGVSSVSLARTIANYDVAQFFVDLPADPPAD